MLQRSAALAHTAAQRAHLHIVDAIGVCAADPARRLVAYRPLAAAATTASATLSPSAAQVQAAIDTAAVELGPLPGDAEWDVTAGMSSSSSASTSGTKDEKKKEDKESSTVASVLPVGLYQLPLSAQLTMWVHTHARVATHLLPTSCAALALHAGKRGDFADAAAPAHASTAAGAEVASVDVVSSGGGALATDAAARAKKLNAIEARVRTLRLRYSSTLHSTTHNQSTLLNSFMLYSFKLVLASYPQWRSSERVVAVRARALAARLVLESRPDRVWCPICAAAAAVAG